MSTQKSYHHGDLKRELIKCAYEMCLRDGYPNLSIRNLAKESKVSQTAPYRHFKSKEKLYAEVARTGFNNLYDSIFINSNLKNKKKQLIKIGKNYLKFGIEHANIYDLMFGTAVPNFLDYPKLQESANRSYLELKTNIKNLTKSSDDAYISKACFTMWALIHGMVGIFRKVSILGADIEKFPKDDAIGSARSVDINIDLYLEEIIESIIDLK